MVYNARHFLIVEAYWYKFMFLFIIFLFILNSMCYMLHTGIIDDIYGGGHIIQF